MKSRAYISRIGLEGVLMALSPCPLALPFLGLESGYPQSWRLIIAALAAISGLVCALSIFR